MCSYSGPLALMRSVILLSNSASDSAEGMFVPAPAATLSFFCLAGGGAAAEAEAGGGALLLGIVVACVAKAGAEADTDVEAP